MIGVAFQLPIWFDLGAVFLLALTGVWAAGRRGYDIIGAFIMAFVTGVGGGLLRDAVFLQEIPLVIRDVSYLWAVTLAVLVGGLTQRIAGRFEHGISYVDAAATGAYGVYGANKALLAGLAPEAALLVGVCNAVGGGLIRDVLVREEPVLLKPGTLFAIAALAGCFSYVMLSYKYGVDEQHAAWIAILLTLLIRILAVRFNWTTRAFGYRLAKRSDDETRGKDG
jgi:uncharacterized membrane protein YeiH